LQEPDFSLPVLVLFGRILVFQQYYWYLVLHHNHYKTSKFHFQAVSHNQSNILPRSFTIVIIIIEIIIVVKKNIS
jgi:hypothetical protein